MSTENINLYFFDDVTVDCVNFSVQKAGNAVTLTPRAFDVLLVLLKRQGRIVDKKELFEEVWRDVIVSDNALTKIIKEIRRALNDDANAPRYIETVPKRGYRFIAELRGSAGLPVAQVHQDQGPVVFATGKSGVSSATLGLCAAGLVLMSAFVGWLFLNQRSVDATPATIRSLAVLPLKPVNTDSRDESLEMGMAETLITRLSNLKHVVVRPMSSVRKYTDLQQDPLIAGQEVRADAVLDGSIQKVGDRIRVTVRLIKVNDGKQVWSEQFDENFTDIFKVQDSITDRITTALTLQLSLKEKEQLAKHLTEDPEAYQHYLRGQLLWNRRRPNWIEQSLAHYQKAIERDPNFALAHIGVADSYIMLSGHRKLSMTEAEARARPSILRALQIDDNLAQAHNALAELKYQYEYDWAGAEVEFEKAIELNPNVAWIRQAYGWFLMSAGRSTEATTEMERARELDPSSITINVGRGRLFYYSRQYDQAIREFENIISIEPNDGSSYFSLYTIYSQRQMYPEAVDAFIKSLSLDGHALSRTEELRQSFRTAGWQGFLRKRLEVMEANARDRVDPLQVANLHARLGQKDEAFAWLEKAFAARDPTILQFKVEPLYDNLRDDPRYTSLLRKVGL